MYFALSIVFYVAPCEARCFHCSMDCGKGTNRTYVPPDRLIEIAEKYLRHRGQFYDKIGLLIGDNPLNYPDIVPFTEYVLGIGAINGLSVNGAAIRDYRGTLRALRDAGDDRAQLSFYGVGDTHDKLAGRDGDFALLFDIAEKATAIGYSLRFRYFVNKKNLAEMKRFLELVEALGNPKIKLVWDIWGLCGRGLNAERLRIDEADRASASVPLPEGWLSEREIVAQVENDSLRYEYFLPKCDMIHFGFSAESVETTLLRRRIEIPIPVDDDEALLEYLDTEVNRQKEIYPRLPELIAEFGDKSNRKLYLPGAYRQIIFERAVVY